MLTTLEKNSIWMIYLFSFLGVAHGIYNIISVTMVTPKVILKKKKEDLEGENDKTEVRLSLEEERVDQDNKELLKKKEVKIEKEEKELTEKQLDKLTTTAQRISEGANIFLLTEYLYLLIFIACFAVIIFLVGEQKQWTFYTTIAFLVGATTSILCGLIGMIIATATNYRTTYSAYYGMGEAFRTAYHGGCVMGFMLVSISVGVLMTLILIYREFYISDNSTLADNQFIFESIAGYGLGGSLVALFCRVGGGIYTKAADVGADLVAKLEMGLEEDDPKNPATIADNVGDNVGDIAGMGSDLFGSLAESLAAGLLVGATSPELISTGGYYYPIFIIASGIVVSILTSFIAILFAKKIQTYRGLEWTIKLQLIISAVLLVPAIVLASLYMLPEKYSIGQQGTVAYKKDVTNKLTMVCPLAGLLSGMLIGLSTEYYTSMSYGPVKGLVRGCKQGAAINIILGLSLGYLSTIIPTLLIAGTVLGSYIIAGMYGIALASLGMLANLPICLAIDGYGPISDNAGGLASMCELPPEIREITDDLDSAGNTTAAIGKGFAIGSACLVALSLFGAFVTRTGLALIDVLTPIILSGLIVGAMLPYLFSALTMKAVGNAAEVMVQAVREDMDNKKGSNEEPDSNKCIQIATNKSLSQMFLPGALIIFIPIILGVLFGPKCVAGYLVGVIISGIQMAISAANSGGSWDNAKKSIKNYGLVMTVYEKNCAERSDSRRMKQKLEDELKENPLREDELSPQIQSLENRISELNREIESAHFDKNHPDYKTEIIIRGELKIYRYAEKASIIGDTVGDPMKDTSGPSLNILIKLSSIISVVFGLLFVKTGWIVS